MNEPIVYVIDDDPSVREALASLLRSAGFRVQTFADGDEFLAAGIEDAPACLVLDVRLPGESGLELQHRLARSNIHIPVIFMAGQGDIRTSVRAMKAGAVEFLTKPFSDTEMLEAIRQAIDRDRAAFDERRQLDEISRRFRSLTPREREVMRFVVAGFLNKQIAAQLGTSEVTVKFQRAHMMHKMQAKSLADLVRLSERLKSSKQAG